MSKYASSLILALKSCNLLKPSVFLTNFNFIIYQQIFLPLLVVYFRNIEIVIHPYNTMPFFHNKSCKNVLIVHDLIFLTTNTQGMTFRQKIGHYYRKLLVSRSIHNADSIITISNETLVSLTNRYGDDIKNKCHIFYNCLDGEWFDYHSETKLKNSILLVGGDAPHKNIDYALSELSGIDSSKSTINLLGVSSKMFCSINEKYPLLDINHCSELSEHDIINLYRSSELVIIPSLQEGFGRPLVEAMASKCQIMCSNLNVFKETVGENAFFFDPTIEGSLQDSISNYLCTDLSINAEINFEGSKKYQICHQAKSLEIHLKNLL